MFNPEETYSQLLENIKKTPRAAVCVSGGSESALILIAAVEALGKENVIALTADTPFFTGEEMNISKMLCDYLGVRHFRPQVSLLSDGNVTSNPADRCYHCKKKIMTLLSQVAMENGFDELMDGTHATSFKTRSSEKALQEFEILSPLKETGITSKDIPKLLHWKGMKAYIHPANACLATRIKTGQAITIKKLRWIRAAENYLQNLGFDLVRVRFDEGKVSVEVEPERVVELEEVWEEVKEELLNMGFSEVSLDPNGYIHPQQTDKTN